MTDDFRKKAAKEIGIKPIYEFNGREIHVIGIFEWTPPLVASWWRGKQVHIVAADVDGNFFLRHCDGSVRYWEHSTETDTIVAKSEREFFRSFRYDTNDILSWWKT